MEEMRNRAIILNYKKLCHISKININMPSQKWIKAMDNLQKNIHY